VHCFNVTREFAENFIFFKSDDNSVWPIKYLEAAIDEKTGRGEFFIKFEGTPIERLLVESFEKQGAGQVSTSTFEHNDGHESASNALLRIFKKQNQGKLPHSRGTCPPGLKKKVQEKLAKDRQEHAQEQGKLAEAIKRSLETNVVKLENIDNKMDTQAVDVENIKENVKSQAADVVEIKEDVKSHAVELVEIKNGVCSVIPDYQRENALLKDALLKKTAACDSIEGRLAYKTTTVKRLESQLAKLQADMQVIELEKQAWFREKVNILQENVTLKEQLDLTGFLKKMMETAQYNHNAMASTMETLTTTTDTLSSTLEEERAAKRARI